MAQTQEFNESITALATQIARLSQRLQAVESQIHGLTGVNESFKKLGQHAANCQPENVKNELQTMQADMLDLAKQVKSMREALASGGNMQQKVTFSKEDLAEGLHEKLAQVSLKDVIEAMH